MASPLMNTEDGLVNKHIKSQCAESIPVVAMTFDSQLISQSDSWSHNSPDFRDSSHHYHLHYFLTEMCPLKLSFHHVDIFHTNSFAQS